MSQPWYLSSTQSGLLWPQASPFPPVPLLPLPPSLHIQKNLAVPGLKEPFLSTFIPRSGLGGDAVSVLHSLSTHACLVKAEKHARAVSVPSFFSKPLSFLSSIWADRQDKAGTLTASRRRVRCRALGTGIRLVWSPEGRRLPGTGAAAGQPEDGSPTKGSAPSE